MSPRPPDRRLAEQDVFQVTKPLPDTPSNREFCRDTVAAILRDPTRQPRIEPVAYARGPQGRGIRVVDDSTPIVEQERPGYGPEWILGFRR